LLAMEKMPLPTAGKSVRDDAIVVSAFGATASESLSRSFHESTEPALFAAVAPLLSRMNAAWELTASRE
ncbi:MAG: hypothetical protein ACXWP4_21165, partial [Polyangiales bacterium]